MPIVFNCNIDSLETCDWSSYSTAAPSNGRAFLAPTETPAGGRGEGTPSGCGAAAAAAAHGRRGRGRGIGCSHDTDVYTVRRYSSTGAATSTGASTSSSNSSSALLRIITSLPPAKSLEITESTVSYSNIPTAPEDAGTLRKTLLWLGGYYSKQSVMMRAAASLNACINEYVLKD